MLSISVFTQKASILLGFFLLVCITALVKLSTKTSSTKIRSDLINNLSVTVIINNDSHTPAGIPFSSFRYTEEQLTPVDISVPRPQIPPLPKIPLRPHVSDSQVIADSTLSHAAVQIPFVKINFNDPWFNRNSSTCNIYQGGQSFPPPPCTKQNPCTQVMHMYDMFGIHNITHAQNNRQRCAGWLCKGCSVNGVADVIGDLREDLEETVLGSKRTIRRRWEWYDDGPIRKITIPQKTFYNETQTRYFCSYVPPQPNATTAEKKKFPLVIFVGGSSSDASMLYGRPLLWRMLANDKNFSLITVQNVNRHWHASGWIGQREDGGKFDDYYKNFTDNDDVKFLDALIDKMVDLNETDPSRIYLFGASNGLMFASFYGIIRSGSRDGGGLLNASTQEERDFLSKSYTGRTPGGNRIAAVAGFSGTDPFKGVAWAKGCRTEPPPRSQVPFLIISRICDIINCVWIKEWVNTLRYRIGSSNVEWLLLDMQGRRLQNSECTRLLQRTTYNCHMGQKLLGHIMWPESYVARVYRFFMRYQSL